MFQHIKPQETPAPCLLLQGIPICFVVETAGPRGGSNLRHPGHRGVAALHPGGLRLAASEGCARDGARAVAVRGTGQKI